MYNITIGIEAYQAAKQYAQHHNLSIDEVVELGVSSLVKSEEHRRRFNILAEKDLSPIVRELTGVVNYDKGDIDGKIAKESYLSEKYE